MPLLLLANRAPVRATPEGWVPALGGLASALLPVLEDRRGGAWVAMRAPGESDPEVQPWPSPEAATLTIQRIPLGEEEYAHYYQGMANRVLWPLAHYLVDHVEPDRVFREAYRAVNRRFAETALALAPPENHPDAAATRFWVQDYHLMLVPEQLRAARPDARIGHFWHIPWPAPEVFRILPAARELLRGMLGADLVGFHTEGYAENFRAAARDLLGARVRGVDIAWEGRTVRAEAHPIGIDAESFRAYTDAPAIVAEARAFREAIGVDHLVLGVDRLDYTKGLLLRLDAFERFLENNPDFHGRVTLLQVATPSRTGVPAYDQLKRDVDEAVGRINGRFAQNAWTPVQYRYRAYPPDELAVLYRSADVGLVTPLRDGMNLVAHEYAAVSEGGALVLSELTGAADYLEGALLVNPYDTDGLAERLREAIEMPVEERRRRLASMRAAVQRLNVHAWATGFLEALEAVPAPGAPRSEAPLPA
ncbi:MAG: trehalose-6-phosphate synthase [Rubricoccaceae bacterium]